MCKNCDDIVNALRTFDIYALSNGDEVYWTDPDGGKCSRHITIDYITIIDGTDNFDDVVCIQDISGDCIDCLASELS